MLTNLAHVVSMTPPSLPGSGNSRRFGVACILTVGDVSETRKAGRAEGRMPARLPRRSLGANRGFPDVREKPT